MNDATNEQFYEALLDDEALERLPGLMADTVGASASIIQWQRPSGDVRVLGYSGFSANAMQAYDERWREHDPWAVAAMQPGFVNRLMLLEEAVPQDEFARSSIYNEFLSREADDTFHCLGAGFSTPWGQGLFGIFRRRSDPAFERADVERIRPYVRTANRVLNLRVELEAARRTKAHASRSLDALALAIVSIDHRGRVLSVNESAEMVLRRADGLVSRQGQLAGLVHADTVALRQAIAQATAAAGAKAEAVRISRRGGSPAYLATVTPVAGIRIRRRALIVFADPEMEDASRSDRLRGLFGLTPAEASIAVQLGQGKSPSEIAAERGVRPNTLSSQLKLIMAKMGCHRQAEVAAVVASLPPLRGG